MTRAEFDARYAATQSNTEGFTDNEIREINEAVFVKIAHLDADPDSADSHVKNMFAHEFDARS